MKKLYQLTLPEKIGQLLMASLNGMELDAEAEAFLSENHVGNLIHFANNVRDREQAAEFNAVLSRKIDEIVGVSPLIAIDHEGGRVLRFKEGVTVFPSPLAIGQTGDEALAEMVGYAMGEELRAMGFHLNLAPVLDINTGLINPVTGSRAYGGDAKTVARFGAMTVRGMQQAGLMACGKHFPGHGDTLLDSHFDLPTVDKPAEVLWQNELYPFAAAIRQGIEAIMTTHILFPAFEPRKVPATMSRDILTGLLREKLGFGGLIISDGMHMNAISKHYGIEHGCVEAIKGGVDILCVGTGGAGFLEVQANCYRALLSAAKSGEIPMERIDDAVSRVLTAKARHCTPFAGRVDWEANAALANRAADMSIQWLQGSQRPIAGQLLCVAAPAVEVRFGVNEANWRMSPFSQVLADAFGGDSAALTEGFDYAMLDEADVVLTAVHQFKGNIEQEAYLMREALRRGKRAVAVITSLPCMAEKLPMGTDVLCTFGLALPSVQAVCRALGGR